MLEDAAALEDAPNDGEQAAAVVLVGGPVGFGFSWNLGLGVPVCLFLLTEPMSL